MARYRIKSPEDLLWNKIRRRLTREFDTQIADWREDALNKLLGSAFEEFVARMESGERVVLEENYNAFVAGALDEAIGLPIIQPAKK